MTSEKGAQIERYVVEAISSILTFHSFTFMFGRFTSHAPIPSRTCPDRCIKLFDQHGFRQYIETGGAAVDQINPCRSAQGDSFKPKRFYLPHQIRPLPSGARSL